MQQPRAQKLDAACIVVAEANQGMERGLTEDKGLGEGPPQDEACKRVEHRSDMHEEVANRRHKGKGSQERVLAVRIKSVASTCRSWGRCPPVLGMVALRGMLTPSAPWDLDGSQIASLGGCCSLSEPVQPCPVGH